MNKTIQKIIDSNTGEIKQINETYQTQTLNEKVWLEHLVTNKDFLKNKQALESKLHKVSKEFAQLKQRGDTGQFKFFTPQDINDRLRQGLEKNKLNMTVQEIPDTFLYDPTPGGKVRDKYTTKVVLEVVFTDLETGYYQIYKVQCSGQGNTPEVAREIGKTYALRNFLQKQFRVSTFDDVKHIEASENAALDQDPVKKAEPTQQAQQDPAKVKQQIKNIETVELDLGKEPKTVKTTPTSTGFDLKAEIAKIDTKKVAEAKEAIRAYCEQLKIQPTDLTAQSIEIQQALLELIKPFQTNG